MSRSSNLATYKKFGIVFPEYAKENKPELTDIKQIISEYPTGNDPMGNPARQVECFVRYRLTGKVERVHPLGVTDCYVKRGVTLEVKTGHGWFIEPNFSTLEQLMEYLDERKNPMIKASHIAYLPYRANNGYDCNDCLFFTAKQFMTIMGEHAEKLCARESRGMWGVAIKPWITEGYAQKSSPKNEEIIREDLISIGLTIEEFAEKMGLELHNI